MKEYITQIPRIPSFLILKLKIVLPKSWATKVSNNLINFMYQWVLRTVGIPGTEERNPHQTSVHAD